VRGSILRLQILGLSEVLHILYIYYTLWLHILYIFSAGSEFWTAIIGVGETEPKDEITVWKKASK